MKLIKFPGRSLWINPDKVTYLQSYIQEAFTVVHFSDSKSISIDLPGAEVAGLLDGSRAYTEAERKKS